MCSRTRSTISWWVDTPAVYGSRHARPTSSSPTLVVVVVVVVLIVPIQTSTYVFVAAPPPVSTHRRRTGGRAHAYASPSLSHGHLERQLEGAESHLARQSFAAPPPLWPEQNQREFGRCGPRRDTNVTTRRPNRLLFQPNSVLGKTLDHVCCLKWVMALVCRHATILSRSRKDISIRRLA